jgi:uncharacterized membrane protein
MPISADPPAPPRSSGAVSWGRPETAGGSSLGLSRRQASLLAYSAGWISGLVLLTLEARDRDVRWHAAQSFVGFGVLTVVAGVLLALAGISLFTSLMLFRVCLWAAQVLIAVGLLLWLWSLMQVARGSSPRWPFIGGLVDRIANV